MVEYSLHVQVVFRPFFQARFQHVLESRLSLSMFSSRCSACSVLVHGSLCVGLIFVFVFDLCSNLV